MSQINVNPPPTVVDGRGSSDRTAAAGINFLTVLVVLVVLAVLAWFLFTGPLASLAGGVGRGDTNINVNPPAQQAPNITVNPPAPGGSGSGSNNAPPSGGSGGR